MASVGCFNNSQGVQAETITFAANISSAAGVGPLEKLESRVAAGAIHDSNECSDAPKCHPETRVAVQDHLYDWIVDGDGASEHPRNVKWVTGPAGSGKTAIMGSLADRCSANGVLGATFFFASWSASIGRRQKTAFVTTIAHQLAQHREDLKTAICNAIEKNPGVFEKNLHVQMEILVSTPLREVVHRSDLPGQRGAIIIDGVDECEAVQYHDTTTIGRRGKPARTNAEDQREILQVLQAAASDPCFPFRILIASRPERVFREFFNPERNPTSFAQKLDLSEHYNADADITLFLETQFNILRDRYNLPPSWPPPGVIQTLVQKASGQFIYAATVIQILNVGQREPPKALLEAILNLEAKMTSNPLEQLDALYTHILESSPDPLLSVRWILAIDKLSKFNSSAFNMNLLLQTDPESDEAEHLLGNLHSLIRIPPRSDQARIQYGFHHKSLLDFLGDPHRGGKLYVEQSEQGVFIWNAFVRACTRACDTRISHPESFLEFLAGLPLAADMDLGSAHSEAHLTPASADWWVSLAIAHEKAVTPWQIFQRVHSSCRWYRCKPGCRILSRSILDRLGSATWIAPGMFWQNRKIDSLGRDRVGDSLDKAINDAERNSGAQHRP